MTLSDSCTVRRENGKLVLEIPEAEILREVGTRDLPGHVVNAEQALNYVMQNIRHVHSVIEDFETNLDHLVHTVLEAAIKESAGILP